MAIAFVSTVLVGIVVVIGIHASEQAFKKVYNTNELIFRVKD